MQHVAEPPTLAKLIPYEKRLDQDSRWALTEGSLYFQGEGAVQKAMRRISERLEQLKIPYAIVRRYGTLPTWISPVH